MVNVDLIGGIGNNMFQYAIARIYADKKNYNLHVNDIHNLQQYFKKVVNIDDRITNNNNILHVGYNSSSKTVQYLDTNQLYNHIG
jgi:predicted transcriptional regulator